MRRFVAHAGIVIIFATMAGCGGGDFETATATGVVTCDGKPVEGAMVYFEPIRGSSTNSAGKAIVGKQGFSYTDAEGKFSISTYDPGGEDGAVIGKHRVRVGTGKAKCDCQTNDEKDVMEVTVTADGDNVFEIVLPPKATRERPIRDGDADDDE